MTSQDSQAIARLRLPLAVGVVFIHLGMGFSGRQIHWQSFGEMDAFRFLGCFVTNELASLAVPLFFVISGYLFFANMPVDGNRAMLATYGHKLRRRVWSLLVPYLIFNILAVAALIINQVIDGHSLQQAAEQYLGGMKWLRNFWDIHTTGSATNVLGVSRAVAYPLDSPLWFVRDLMVLVIMSPVIYYALRWLRWGWLVLMVVLTLTGIWIPLPGFGVSSCLYFSIGAWFGLTGRSMGESLRRWRWWLLLIALPAMLGDIWSDGTEFDQYLHLLALISGLLCVYAFVANSNHGIPVPSWCAPASFFVFAVHTLPIPWLGCRPVEWCKSLLWSGSQSALQSVLEFVATGVLTAAICLAAYLLLRAIAPSFVNLLTGRK